MRSFAAALILFVMLCVGRGISLPRQLLLVKKSFRLSRSPLSAVVNDWSSASKGTTLIIVESPAKARTIQNFVDAKANIVDFSAGHIRDLPDTAEASPDLKDQVVCAEIRLKASSLGIDVQNGFKPHYVNSPGKADVIQRLQKLSKKATRIILATDEDREGEAISWHLTEVLKPTVPYKRAVFHEITKDAILKAFENPRDIDMNLVHSQETRRVLDRLAGYTVSPILWRYVAPGLSAGRVQSCGLHSITERERSRWRFVPSSYCSVSVLLDYQAHTGGSGTLLTRLQSIDSRKVATDKDFDSATGEIRKTTKSDDLVVLDETTTAQVGAWLSGKASSRPMFTVTDVDVRKISRKPPQPFITSSLQQEASKKHGFSPARTMSIAQGLYEKGHITYMRTDSYTLSAAALEVSRQMVVNAFGSDHLSGTAPAGKAKTGKDAAPKNAQEAHEAIRPADVGGTFALPDALDLTSEERTLYSLILRRTLASVMAPSQAVSNTYTITAREQSPGAPAPKSRAKTLKNAKSFSEAVFKSSDTVTVFPGYQAALTMFDHARKGESKDSSAVLSNGQVLQLSSRRDWTDAVITASVEADVDAAASDGEESAAKFVDGVRAARHHTRPPSRFTEAAFIQEMEELGVGRPSTYSAIFQVLKERGYVVVDRQTVIPTVKGMVVSAFLEKYFPQFVDAQFTAEMERNLDLIADGERDKQDFLRRFYLHNPEAGTPSAASVDSKSPAAKLDRETIMNKGLLPAVAELFNNGQVDQAETRILEVPFLQDLGVLILNRDTVMFEAYETAVKPCHRSGRQWALPDDMQGDMRQITPEGIRSLMLTPHKTHTVLGEHPGTKLPLSFRTSKYGPYIHMMGRTKEDTIFFSLPRWVSEQSFTLEDALLYTALPKELGKHSELDAQVLLDARQGDLILTVEGFNAKAILPAGTVPQDVTLESALALLPSTEAIKSSGGDLGYWKCELVTVCKGPYGPYVRCGKTIASLKDEDFASITLDAAIYLLQTVGRKIGSKVRWKGGSNGGAGGASSKRKAAGKVKPTEPEAEVVSVKKRQPKTKAAALVGGEDESAAAAVPKPKRTATRKVAKT